MQIADPSGLGNSPSCKQEFPEQEKVGHKPLERVQYGQSQPFGDTPHGTALASPVGLISEEKPERMSGSSAGFSLNDFRFHEQIGVGKFGLVYRAVETKSQKEVAIKIVPKKKITSERLYRQLAREIQIHSRLKHDHIVELFAYFTDKNSVYLVMEYCAKGSLASVVKEGQMSSKKIAAVISGLVGAIAYLRERSVMHRDIKLQNILFDANYEAKLADFGWCAHVATPRFTFCGTMEYICPQMVNKQPYSFEVDMYCLGIILYELFVGKSPFLDSTEEVTLENIRKGEILFPEDKNVPEDAKQAIRGMLNPDWSLRPTPQQLFRQQFFRRRHQNN